MLCMFIIHSWLHYTYEPEYLDQRYIWQERAEAWFFSSDKFEEEARSFQRKAQFGGTRPGLGWQGRRMEEERRMFFHLGGSVVLHHLMGAIMYIAFLLEDGGHAGGYIWGGGVKVQGSLLLYKKFIKIRLHIYFYFIALSGTIV